MTKITYKSTRQKDKIMEFLGVLALLIIITAIDNYFKKYFQDNAKYNAEQKARLDASRAASARGRAIRKRRLDEYLGIIPEPEALKVVVPYLLTHVPTLSELLNSEPIDSYVIFTSAATKLEYMQTEKWRQLKDFTLHRHNNKCAGCSTQGRLEIHHLSYRNLGNENNYEVVPLCRECHQRQHDTYGYDRATIYYPIIRKG